jgi:hypothetical protein
MTLPERLLVTDTELSRLALVLAQRSVQRRDLYAHQLDDGSYFDFALWPSVLCTDRRFWRQIALPGDLLALVEVSFQIEYPSATD